MTEKKDDDGGGDGDNVPARKEDLLNRGRARDGHGLCGHYSETTE